ncbi:MAG: RNA polymerase sigma factor [Planctomycetota bacterium]
MQGFEPETSSETEGGRLEAHAGRLRLLVLHLAGRAILARVEAEDLVQEVFLRALSSGLPPRDPDDPGDQWLFRLLARIARNAVVDAARAIRAARRDGREEPLARSEWSRFEGGMAESRIPAGGAGPPTRAAGSETHEALSRAFLALAPDHRRVIGLRQFEGLSAAEAGVRMGRSETAVHSLYRRALEAWEAASRPGR